MGLSLLDGWGNQRDKGPSVHDIDARARPQPAMEEVVADDEQGGGGDGVAMKKLRCWVLTSMLRNKVTVVRKNSE